MKKKKTTNAGLMSPSTETVILVRNKISNGAGENSLILKDRPSHSLLPKGIDLSIPFKGRVLRKGLILKDRPSYSLLRKGLTGLIFNHEILACGAHLKNTFALTKENRVIISDRLKNLGNLESLNSFEKGIERFKRLFNIEPLIIAHDLHPEYLSTKYAKSIKAQNPNLKIVAIQHHHAHIASCLIDNQIGNRKVIGVAFDGTGFGEDGNIWGAEFLLADYADSQRIAHLEYIPLPGGEQAIKEPWRMAATYLYQAYGEDFLDLDLAFTQHLDKYKWAILKKMMQQKINCPLTSSMGRLFDAVSSLLGIRDVISYEGQAAIELEKAIGKISDSHSQAPSYKYTIREKNSIFIIEPKDIITGIVQDLNHALDAGAISFKFHHTVVEMIVDICKIIRQRFGLKEVALSGGVFQNAFLSNRAFSRLKEEGFKVYIHHRVPANDAGISLGQAIIAQAKLGKS